MLKSQPGTTQSNPNRGFTCMHRVHLLHPSPSTHASIRLQLGSNEITWGCRSVQLVSIYDWTSCNRKMEFSHHICYDPSLLSQLRRTNEPAWADAFKNRRYNEKMHWLRRANSGPARADPQPDFALVQRQLALLINQTNSPLPGCFNSCLIVFFLSGRDGHLLCCALLQCIRVNPTWPDPTLIFEGYLLRKSK